MSFFLELGIGPCIVYAPLGLGLGLGLGVLFLYRLGLGLGLGLGSVLTMVKGLAEIDGESSEGA